MSITPKKQMENACEISPHTWPEPEGVRCEQESRDRRRTGRLAPRHPRPLLQRRIMTRMMKSRCLLAVAALVAAKSCGAHPDVSAASAAGLVEKYNPGHYVAISERETVSGIQHLDEPALRGVSRRYYWADLEPKEGVYDFAAIRQDLEFLKQHRKQLVVFITDKTFSPGRNRSEEHTSELQSPM